jgi:hypothetical protein
MNENHGFPRMKIVVPTRTAAITGLLALTVVAVLAFRTIGVAAQKPPLPSTQRIDEALFVEAIQIDALLASAAGQPRSCELRCYSNQPPLELIQQATQRCDKIGGFSGAKRELQALYAEVSATCAKISAIPGARPAKSPAFMEPIPATVTEPDAQLRARAAGILGPLGTEITRIPNSLVSRGAE